MNTEKARYILNEAAQLVELVSMFQARYGRHYQLKPGSPEDAWSLHEHIELIESRIARLLDESALDNAFSRHGEWWKRQDVMDSGIARALLNEAGQLISCCAHANADAPHTEWSYAIQTSQMSIAGLLSSASRQIAADRNIRLDAV